MPFDRRPFKMMSIAAGLLLIAVALYWSLPPLFVALVGLATGAWTAFLGIRQRARRAFAQLFNELPDGFVLLDQQQRIVDINPAALHQLGYERVQPLLATPLQALIVQQGEGQRTQLRHISGEVLEFDLLQLKVPPLLTPLSQGTLLCLGSSLDRRQRLLADVVEQSPVGIVISTTDHVIEYVNASMVKAGTHQIDSLIDRPMRTLVDPTFHDQQLEAEAHLQRGECWQGEFRGHHRNGDGYWELATFWPMRDAQGQVSHHVGLRIDITPLKEREDVLLRQASHDDLTGLPNRALALDRLEQAISTDQRSAHWTAVIFIDLDRFKPINDHFGHRIGDLLLVEVAHRLQTLMRASDTLARISGDEFLAIAKGLGNAHGVELVAMKLLHALQQPFAIEGHSLLISASLGIALCPEDGTDPIQLIRNADAAMYRAKQAGKGCFRFYTPDLHSANHRRLIVETRLRDALENQAFDLRYQPLISAADLQPVGAEALLRWTDDELGAVLPDEFIPLAEETGLITPMGEWVLHRVCGLIKRLDNHPLRLSLNLSAFQLSHGDFRHTLQQVITKSGIDPGYLELEINESMLLGDDQSLLQELEQLRAIGVALAIDDFGRGQSSLGLLSRFPFQTVKIDQQFMVNIPDDTRATALARGIIELGHSLGLEIVGEGIETTYQRDFLRQHGCDLMQGYLFNKPMSEEQLLAWLTDHD